MKVSVGQIRPTQFFDETSKLIQPDWMFIIKQVRAVNHLDWVLTTAKVLSEPNEGKLDIITGGSKVAVIDKTHRFVYTFEIVSRAKHAQKEETYKMLDDVQKKIQKKNGKLQIKLPRDTYHVTSEVPEGTNIEIELGGDAEITFPVGANVTIPVENTPDFPVKIPMAGFTVRDFTMRKGTDLKIPEGSYITMQVERGTELSIPVGTELIAYFNKTDYCNEVFSLLEKFPGKDFLNMENTVFDNYFLQLMQTYMTLCDDHIYLTDIKPENIISCDDGLYFIDIDDVSVVKDISTLHLSKQWSPFFSTSDYYKSIMYMKNPKNGYTLSDIRIFLEYEGWQALCKVYFTIRTGRNIDLEKPDDHNAVNIWLQQKQDKQNSFIATKLLEVFKPQFGFHYANHVDVNNNMRKVLVESMKRIDDSNRMKLELKKPGTSGTSGTQLKLHCYLRF